MDKSLDKIEESSLGETYKKTVSNRRNSRKINSVSFDKMY